MFNLPDTKTLYNRLKASAKKRKIPFDLKLTDLHTLGYYINCPVLGIPLDYSGKQLNDNSPTVDRIDSSKGYTANNIIIVSWRCNRSKNDLSSEEIKKIAEFYENLT